MTTADDDAPASDGNGKPSPKMEPREPKGVYFAGGMTYREGMTLRDMV